MARSYTDSMDRLSTESSVSLSKWAAADNVDLASVMQEFESFYELKYGRAPRMVRPASGEEAEEVEKAAAKAKRKSVRGCNENRGTQDAFSWGSYEPGTSKTSLRASHMELIGFYLCTD